MIYSLFYQLVGVTKNENSWFPVKEIVPSLRFCSAADGDLFVSCVITNRFGRQPFAMAGRQLWNQLPVSYWHQMTLGNDVIDVTDAVRVLGVAITPDLSLDKHVTTVKSAFSSCVSCAEFGGHLTMNLWRL